MISVRHCSKPGCTRQSVATLTYDYHESTAVLGPLATAAEPHTYDLCELHAEHLTVPRGWQVVRLHTTFEPAEPSEDDLMALVNAVRQAAQSPRTTADNHNNATVHSLHEHRSRTTPPEPHEIEYGPFAQPRSNSTDQSAQIEDAHRSPLDPQSPWAKRRDQFRIVPEEKDDDTTTR
ncbi:MULTISPECIES: DUF3499 domain-containing protein [unclassified Schaalia]|uniref:DUF3499 domain-containing protein n=1 Tax=unclassified Schaalia TaxID=2691889 RepID=UPI001E4D13C8|nr:DUF3499 domain-containing protein [Schaalia sp. lx-260]MCD4556750.1 DUF3499 domain-containing protein [Schaalia sp. lx-100]